MGCTWEWTGNVKLRDDDPNFDETLELRGGCSGVAEFQVTAGSEGICGTSDCSGDESDSKAELYTRWEFVIHCDEVDTYGWKDGNTCDANY